MTNPSFIPRKRQFSRPHEAADLEHDAAVLDGLAALVRAAPLRAVPIEYPLLRHYSRALEACAEECRRQSLDRFPSRWKSDISADVMQAHRLFSALLVARIDFSEAEEDADREEARQRWCDAYTECAARAAVDHGAFALANIDFDLIEGPPELDGPSPL